MGVKKEESNQPGLIQKWLIKLAEMAGFTYRVLKEMVTPPYEVKEILKQSYQIGYSTLILVGFTSFIAGIVFTRQSRPSLIDFGAESLLPSLVAVSIIRGLGPLFAALIFAGKIASNIAAELSSMNVTEQIDAMKVSGTNPFRFLVITRVTASTLMLPILVIFADAVSIFGSFLNTYFNSQTSAVLYYRQAFDSISYLDILTSIVKPIFFGFAVGIISTYCGYYSERATVGVGKAANTAVVTSMVFIFIIDFIALQFIEPFR